MNKLEIITKNSSTPGAVPADAALKGGELAVNLSDGKLFVGSGTKTIEIGKYDPLTIVNCDTPDAMQKYIDANDLSYRSHRFILKNGVTHQVSPKSFIKVDHAVVQIMSSTTAQTMLKFIHAGATTPAEHVMFFEDSVFLMQGIEAFTDKPVRCVVTSGHLVLDTFTVIGSTPTNFFAFQLGNSSAYLYSVVAPYCGLLGYNQSAIDLNSEVKATGLGYIQLWNNSYLNVVGPKDLVLGGETGHPITTTAALIVNQNSTVDFTSSGTIFIKEVTDGVKVADGGRIRSAAITFDTNVANQYNFNEDIYDITLAGVLSPTLATFAVKNELSALQDASANKYSLTTKEYFETETAIMDGGTY